MKLKTQHIGTLLGYIGIGFIAGSVSHGVFSWERSLATALIGVAAFIVSEILLATEPKPDYLKHTLVAIVFSVSVGMVSGGLQHFLDSPVRSAIIIPLGFALSFAILVYKEKANITSYLLYLLGGTGILALICYLILAIAPYGNMRMMMGDDHHMMGNGNMMNSQMPSMGKMAAHDMTVTSEFEFIAMMIPHHQEAVDTSLIVNESTTNPELKTLTQNIITAQKSEIEMMKQRLQQGYPNQQFTGEYHAMMRPLQPLVGQERDMVWIQDMIGHHKGAVQMAQSVLKLNPKSEIKTFAENVITEQSKEIQQMEMMLQGHDHH